MDNSRIRMTLDLELNEEALSARNLTAQDILQNIKFDPNNHLSGLPDGILEHAQVISTELTTPPDRPHRMVCMELEQNGVQCYGMDPEEVQTALRDESLINGMVQSVDYFLSDGDKSEQEALEDAFRASFPWMLASHRLRALNVEEAYLDAANQSIYLRDNRIFYNEDHQLCCQLEGEDLVRPLRHRIQNIEAGDAFFSRDCADLQTTSHDAHKNVDENEDIWIVYGDDGDYYFEEDVNSDFTAKVAYALDKIYPTPVPSRDEPPLMTVLKVEPGLAPYKKEIEPGLESLQHEVSGHIEVVYPFEEPVGILCNEEAKLIGMELNRGLRDDDGDLYDILAGPFLVVGLGEEDFRSLTDEELEHFSEFFHSPELFFRMNGKIVGVSYDPIPDHLLEQSRAEKTAVTMDTSGLAIDTLVGTWHTIDQAEVDGHTFYLMEHDTYGDETACAIVDEQGRLSLTDIYDGFDEHTLDLLHQELMPVAQMPDESISVDEMKAYGYGWGGMLPLRAEKATELINEYTIYALYPDHTESTIEPDQIKGHAARNGIFGIEKQEWNAKQQAHGLDSVLENAKDRATNNPQQSNNLGKSDHDI